MMIRNKGFCVYKVLIGEVILNFKSVLQVASTALTLTLILQRHWETTVFFAVFQSFLLYLALVVLSILHLRAYWLTYSTVVLWLTWFVGRLLGRVLVEVGFITEGSIDSFSHFRHNVGFLSVEIAGCLIFRWHLMRERVAAKWLLHHRVRCRFLVLTVRSSQRDVLLFVMIMLVVGVGSTT